MTRDDFTDRVASLLRTRHMFGRKATMRALAKFETPVDRAFVVGRSVDETAADLARLLDAAQKERV